MTKGTVISERTLIPVSLVIVLVGGVVWMTTIYSKVNAAEAAVAHYTNSLEKIDQRLSRIEGALGVHPDGN